MQALGKKKITTSTGGFEMDFEDDADLENGFWGAAGSSWKFWKLMLGAGDISLARMRQTKKDGKALEREWQDRRTIMTNILVKAITDGVSGRKLEALAKKALKEKAKYKGYEISVWGYPPEGNPEEGGEPGLDSRKDLNTTIQERLRGNEYSSQKRYRDALPIAIRRAMDKELAEDKKRATNRLARE